MSTSPDFRSPAFLRAHIADTMAFYHPRCIDPNGGFFHYFRDDGSIYDANHRHLVSSTRFVFNYAMAYREFGNAEYREAVEHGVRYLREVHRNPATGGYAWTLRDGKVEDDMNHCYGVAFVLLAYSCALKAGLEQARAWMDETWQLLEARFWEPQHGLYKDEADGQWNFTGYRGQNANMHMCEAMLAAFEASGEQRYVERALQLANNMTRRQAAKAGGLVWEHYDSNWEIDWDYNLDDPKHLFRPWGLAGPPDRMGQAVVDPGPPCAGRLAGADRAAPVRRGCGAQLGRGAGWPVLRFRAGVAPAAGHGWRPDRWRQFRLRRRQVFLGAG